MERDEGTGRPTFDRPTMEKELPNIFRGNLVNLGDVHRVTEKFGGLGIPPDSVFGVAPDIHRMITEASKRLHDLHKSVQPMIGAKIQWSRWPGLNRRPLPSRVPVLLAHWGGVRLYIEHIPVTRNLAPLVSRSGAMSATVLTRCLAFNRNSGFITQFSA